MSVETWAAFTWIYSTLTGDSALIAKAVGGVWESSADLGTVAPYALYVQQSSEDVNTLNGVRLFTRKLLQIKAVGPTKQYADLVVIAGRIDSLFKDIRNVALASGGVLSSTRAQELAYNDNVNGASWSHLGGLYELQLQGS